MRNDFRNHLLIQIEMLRAGISHEELSKRLGPRTEGCLARYIAGKTNLQDTDFQQIAKAIGIDAEILARRWAVSIGLRIKKKHPVRDMVQAAFYDYVRHKRVPGVHPHPSPISVIRVKYADRLSLQAPSLWLGRKDTPKGRERFVRAYKMLVESVHEKRSYGDIGALRGITGQRARQLMMQAAYRWARAEGIDLLRDRIPWKNEARLVRNLYAGLRFFARPESLSRVTDAQQR